MAKLLPFALFPLLLLAGCNPPWGGDCACTAMACSEGVRVSLVNYPDTSRYEDMSVSLVYGDTVEAPSPIWSNGRTDLWFSSPKLTKLRPKRVAIRIAYRFEGADKTASADRDLAWSPFVCNHCSGSSVSCKDDSNYRSDATLDLKPLL